jgi:hypothetical protein
MVPATSWTWAPQARHSSMNGRGVSSGMATTTGSPARAP